MDRKNNMPQDSGKNDRRRDNRSAGGNRKGVARQKDDLRRRHDDDEERPARRKTFGTGKPDSRKQQGGYQRRNKSNRYGENTSQEAESETFRPRTGGNRRPQRPFAATPQRRPRPAAKKPAGDESVRLNKYISNAGICSRRDADKLIEAGAVSVNGEVVTTLGYKVQPGDVVSYGGEVLRSERKRYFLLNKPKGFITTLDDPHDRHTVMMLVENCCKERIYPVGRLDRNTTGLLLFTNDGELAKKLTHPSSNVYKIYNVELDRPVSRKDMEQLLEGVELDDGPIAVDDVQYQGDDHRIVGVAIHSGRNRVVRRIFESLGYEVHKLDRTVFAGLTKKDLPRGRARELTEQEVGYLKMI